MDADVQRLRAFVSELRAERSACAQPAEEWLLDHAEFIEEQVLVVFQQSSTDFLRKLPHLHKTGEARVLAICSDYLDHMDGSLDEYSFMSYIESYQEVSVLTIAEVWAIPLMMRMALIDKLAGTMDVVQERRQLCGTVERLLKGIEPSSLSPERLNKSLEGAGVEMPLSGPLIAHLTKHLREWSEDTAEVRDWLICKLENGAESLDRIVSYEYQLQASFHLTTGNLIGSLRFLSRLDWNELFERINIVEQTLREETSGDYKLLDFSSRDSLRKRVEQLAGRLRVPENLIAVQAVELAAQAYEKTWGELGDLAQADHRQMPRQAFVAYYLLDPVGVNDLRRALTACSAPRAMPEAGILRRATGTYFNLIAVAFVLFLTGFALWTGTGEGLLPLEWMLALLVLAPLAMEWAIAGAHWLIECVKRPLPLLRYDFSRQVPAEAASMVVIPVIWSTVEQVREMVEKLELHYLANRDANIHFALLSDFTDAKEEKQAKDQGIIDAARAGIEALNKAYPGSTFHLFQRRRLWNPSEGVWMGWERKRGKLVEFVELLKGSRETTYNAIASDSSILSSIRYVITLDADTQLPLGSAQRMIGTLHLPYNHPRLNDTKTRVVEGYGVLQPRIGMSHESALRSRLAYLWSSDPGVDPYAFAVSDPYQDGVGQGIFTGKGIFDVDTFHQVLCDRIPDNRVLSHDLLEGGFLRAGLLSDIELIDGHPATFSAYQKRLHRWVRGDWQLLLWLLPRVEDRRGARAPVDLTPLSRWQIIDNMRRSLLPPVLFAIALLAMIGLPGSPGVWLTLVLATLLLPVIRQLISLRQVIRYPKSLLVTLGQAAVTLITLPFQCVLLISAIFTTVNRLLFTKRRLLEWVSSAEIERHSQSGSQPALTGMLAGYALILIFAGAAFRHGEISVQFTGLILSALWACAPFVIRWLDQPVDQPVPSISEAEATELRTLSRQIWLFFEDYVTEHEHWLPPDNVQIEPPNGIAHRTSPTNIGLYLACALAARDFEFITTAELIERLERTVDTIERLDKWEGHLYNWYDTSTLNTLFPLYVSTVDSGNFVACLLTVKEGLTEWLAADLMPQRHPDEGLDTRQALNVAFAEELTPVMKKDKITAVERTRSGRNDDNEWTERGNRLLTRLEALVEGTNFRPLYDEKSKLFTLGYHAGEGRRDQVLYDLMASEARQASFVAIAMGQVSVAHWNMLGRTMTKAGKRTALLSWSGTMFEYLMPHLLMKSYRNTLWDSTYQAVVQRQIEYAEQRGVPFGISESGYYAYDFQMNYQYRAFGVPGLGFKRGLEEDLVVAPYATVLALPFAKDKALETLRRMEKLGGRGKYGYYEAIDFTPDRMPKDKEHMTIQSFMAHHQGMSLLTLSNLLLPQTMQGRFHRDKRVRAAELLLQERVPVKPKVIQHPAMTRVHSPAAKSAEETAVREYPNADTRTPEVCVLSNGAFSTVITASGGGFSRYGDVAVSRWREDPVTDHWGSFLYIRDVAADKVWSPSYQPCRVPSAEQRIQFGLDKALFMRMDGEIQTKLEITVSPESNAEIRRLTLTNTGKETKIIEVTTFLEVALAHPIADDAHPAFSKLFINTEYAEQEECIVARRRPRDEKEQTLCAAHSLMVEGHALGPVEFETDRTRFVGRGHSLSDPRGLRSRLTGTCGSVADPAFIIRRRINIEPGQNIRLYAVTAVADTKEEAVNTVQRYRTEQVVERSFQLAWTRGNIELRHLQLMPSEAMSFQSFAGQILYTPPLRKERADRIRDNTKGQSGLWAYGVSGDRPIILVRIDNQTHMGFIVKLLYGHEYLRRAGLAFDLIILNESAGGYQQDLQDALMRAVRQDVDRHGAEPAGIAVIPANQLPEEDRTLLIAAARVQLRANGPSLKAQMKLLRGAAELPPELVPTALKDRFGSAEARQHEDTSDLLFFNGWGGFVPEQNGQAYRIVIKNRNHLPAPWINVLANEKFGCLVSELGTGYSWWRNSRECKLTPWSNDPVLDPPAEKGYLRDEESGELWSLTPSEASSVMPYSATHSHGYSRFCHERNGISHDLTVFVPLAEPVKVMLLRLRNRTSVQRRLSITYYAEWVLGVKRQTNASFIVTEWDEAACALLARNTYQETFRDAHAFVSVYGEDGSTDDSDALSWTADRSEFIGRNGTIERPAAMSRQYLSGQTGTLYDSCGAVQAKMVLDPGEERIVPIVLGCEHSREAAAALARKYSQPAVCEQSLAEVRQFWERTLGQTKVSTPNKEMDIMLNGWLLYQSLACRMWARSAFYQAGGAYGYRDQLQDSLSMLHTRPDLTRSQIKLHAAHQYEEGDVQHWWHEETKRGIRTHFSDDLLWLPYAVSRYIVHTGDDSILGETEPFLRSELLKEGEHERYEETVLSPKSGTVLEHCLRAIDRALQRIGEHGLPLIGIGDWNDGMNHVGSKGRGESVWLGWFIIEVLKRFEAICREHDLAKKADHYEAVRAKLTAALDTHAWDGQWYRRAFTDHGEWLGTIRGEECRIDAIAQSWSVISGGAPMDKAMQAMQSFDRELVDRDLRLVRLLTPPFFNTKPSPGYIQGYPPGIRENGAQYTHGVIWSIVAWCRLGKGDKAFELFHLLNPITHALTSNEVRQYTGEPYVMAADIYTADPHRGHAGWTWYTGAAGWMYQAGVEWILGITRQGARLHLCPCIPSEWPEYSVSYRFDTSHYHITISNPSRKSSGASALQVDGRDTAIVKDDGQQGLYVDLLDDGKEHRIVLTM
ncbi:glycosyl transferase [Paenibacillus abyssi]|uniref:Glycosyl transferase n=2 Tax=Paenibacillus abyssi TaxID=1340531 RepID=A0A917CPP6_9BACL|nr:glycosyl transferase [Paenibacillus abyssi]